MTYDCGAGVDRRAQPLVCGAVAEDVQVDPDRRRLVQPGRVERDRGRRQDLVGAARVARRRRRRRGCRASASSIAMPGKSAGVGDGGTVSTIAARRRRGARRDRDRRRRGRDIEPEATTGRGRAPRDDGRPMEVIGHPPAAIVRCDGPRARWRPRHFVRSRARDPPFRALRYDRATIADLGARRRPAVRRHRRRTSTSACWPATRPTSSAWTCHATSSATSPTIATVARPGRSPAGGPTGRSTRIRIRRSTSTSRPIACPGTDVERTQRGFFARLRLEAFGPRSGVLPHERTLAGRARGPLQAAPGDRRQHEPGRRPVRRPGRPSAGRSSTP